MAISNLERAIVSCKNGAICGATTLLAAIVLFYLLRFELQDATAFVLLSLLSILSLVAAMLALARKIEPKTSKIALVVTIGFWGAIAWLAGRETLSRLAALAALGILPESAWFRVTFSTLTSSIWHLISIVNFAFLFRKHTRVSSSSQPGLVINMTPAIFRIALASAGNVAIALIQIIISI